MNENMVVPLEERIYTANNYGLEISAGRVHRMRSESKFGSNTAATAGGDCWRGSGVYTGQPTGSPEPIELLSSSALDTATGTGMRTARIWGLKTATQSESSADISMTGTSGAADTSEWYRVYRVKGLTYGSGGKNAGIITARHTSTTTNIKHDEYRGRSRPGNSN